MSACSSTCPSSTSATTRRRRDESQCLALVLEVVFLALAFGCGAGSSDGAPARPGSCFPGATHRRCERSAAVCFVVGVVLIGRPVAGSPAGVDGARRRDGVPSSASGWRWRGSPCDVAAQLAMGDSWRIGVDPDERTELVTGGPFASVRNPIFSAMSGDCRRHAARAQRAHRRRLCCALVGLELQVRLVEEPYLAYAPTATATPGTLARAGRFLPGLGRPLPA